MYLELQYNLMYSSKLFTVFVDDQSQLFTNDTTAMVSFDLFFSDEFILKKYIFASTKKK